MRKWFTSHTAEPFSGVTKMETSSKSIAPMEGMSEPQLMVAVQAQERQIYEEAKGTLRERYETEAIKIAFTDVKEYEDISQIKKIHSILEHIGSGKVVLDCSGDSGYIASLLRTSGNDVTVLSRSMINLNRAKWLRKLKTVFWPSDKISFPNKSFDIVILPTIQDTDNLGVFLEAKRVCKADGEIILSIDKLGTEYLQFSIIDNKILNLFIKC